MAAGSYQYEGNELILFQQAHKWKKYFAAQLIPCISGRVLEVGAGLGATTQLLYNGKASDWLLLEPDASMCEVLQTKIKDGNLPALCRVQTGTIDLLDEKFDTIIYIDVLEHIRKDREELFKAASLLNPGGHLLVLSPAFPHLYSPFDKAIGHYRRYTRRSLGQLAPASLRLIRCRYYDSFGYLAALANKVFLRQQYPGIRQVLFWDRWLIPLSRIIDQLLFHLFGKSILAVWKKGATD
ncbi:MAG: class I SAM-dependent methyltransferase [Sphingobacteriales bacterium]|nr:class I SAM-dependent methyltransferase [Sphingobacteriales bacterium]